MEGTEIQNDIQRLMDAVETAVGRKIQTPRDFEFLRETIYSRIRVLLSVSTLKRVWNYMPRGELRESTLSTIASFLGYASWESFKKAENSEASAYVMGRRLWVPQELEQGAEVSIWWQPERECLTRYLGDCRFEVIDSRKTRLQPGDTFRCQMIIEGEPLFLDDLIQQNRPPVAYVCGKIAGVRFAVKD